MNWLLGITRLLLRLPPPRISPAEAVQLAVAEVARRGGGLKHPPAEPPKAMEGLRDWEVWLDPGFIPSRVVVVDNQTGEIKKYLSPPR